MLTRTKRRILFYASILIFFIGLFPVVLYSLGYGISSGFKIVRTGGIYIQASESGADVLAGPSRKTTSFISKGALIKNLLPGTYQVSVEKSGFLKWEKKLRVESELVTSREVLLVPSALEAQNLGKAAPAFADAKPNYPSVKKFWPIGKTGDFLILGEDKNFYKNENLPAGKAGAFDVVGNWGTTSAEILKSKKNSFFDESFSRIIYWDAHNIDSYWFSDINKMSEWQKERNVHVFSSDSALDDLKIYPDWPSYLIAVSGDGIYVLNMDGAGGQNIFPVYKGKKPGIFHLDGKNLIIKDSGNFFKITLP